MSVFDDMACRMRPVVEQAADPCPDFLGVDPHELQSQLASGETTVTELWTRSMANMVPIPDVSVDWAAIIVIGIVGYVLVRVLFRMTMPRY